MTDAGAEAMDSDVPGACVRVGEQTIQLMQLSTPDPFDVDPTYSMSAPPPGYVCNGRPVHAGRDRHVRQAGLQPRPSRQGPRQGSNPRRADRGRLPGRAWSALLTRVRLASDRWR